MKKSLKLLFVAIIASMTFAFVACGDDDDFSASANRFLFNVGEGAEYAFTSKISAGLDIKYQYLKNFNRLPITIGVSYRF